MCMSYLLSNLHVLMSFSLTTTPTLCHEARRSKRGRLLLTLFVSFSFSNISTIALITITRDDFAKEMNQLRQEKKYVPSRRDRHFSWIMTRLFIMTCYLMSSFHHVILCVTSRKLTVRGKRRKWKKGWCVRKKLTNNELEYDCQA